MDLSGRKVKVIKQVYPWKVGEIIHLHLRLNDECYFVNYNGQTNYIIRKDYFALLKPKEPEEWM